MKKIVFIVLAHILIVVIAILIFGAKVHSPDTEAVKLYFYNPNLDQGPGGAQCSQNGLVAVNRSIPKTQTPIQDTVRLLLKGEISSQEKASGLTTDFPLPGVELIGANLQNGTLTLSFADPENKTSGGSCRVIILQAQIKATAKQFPGVNEVKYIPETLLQP